LWAQEEEEEEEEEEDWGVRILGPVEDVSTGEPFEATGFSTLGEGVAGNVPKLQRQVEELIAENNVLRKRLVLEEMRQVGGNAKFVEQKIWLLDDEGEQWGPISLVELIGHLAEEEVSLDHHAWMESFYETWKTVREVLLEYVD